MLLHDSRLDGILLIQQKAQEELFLKRFISKGQILFYTTLLPIRKDCSTEMIFSIGLFPPPTLKIIHSIGLIPPPFNIYVLYIPVCTTVILSGNRFRLNRLRV